MEEVLINIKTSFKVSAKMQTSKGIETQILWSFLIRKAMEMRNNPRSQLLDAVHAIQVCSKLFSKEVVIKTFILLVEAFVGHIIVSLR